MISLNINGKTHRLDVPPDMPLLWAIRDHLGLTGAKYGCGEGICGACTVHVDGRAQRACILPVSAAAGREITTIEGLDHDLGRALQAAWRDLNVVQCGFCQPGQIMGAVDLLARNPRPDDDAIDAAMAPYLCRCGTYQRMRDAIKRAAGELDGEGAA